MSWSVTDYVPPWGDSGERPPDNTQYDGGDTLNEKHLDYLWSSLRTLQEEMQSALADIDSDADGVVDEADSANAYGGNDIDSDGDGVVDAADDTATVKGNDIDSDGDGIVDAADEAENVTGTYRGNDIDSDGDGTVDDTDQYDGTAPSGGSSGQFLQTDTTTVSWSALPADWSGDGTFLSPDAPEIGIDVDRVQNADYKEDHAIGQSNIDVSTLSNTDSIQISTGDSRDVEFRNSQFYIPYVTGGVIESYDASGTNTNSLSTSGGSPVSVTFNDDGTKMFVADSSTDGIEEHDLSTPYDISTASYTYTAAGISTLYDGDTSVTTVGFNEGDVIRWNDDGSSFYFLHSSDGSVHEIPVGTDYDVLTHQDGAEVLDLTPQTSTPTGLGFDSDGDRLYVYDNNDGDLHGYTLSSSRDVSTATFGAAKNVSSPSNDEYGVSVGEGDRTLHVATSSGSAVEHHTGSHEYTVDLSVSNTQKVTLSSDTTISFSGVDTSRSNSCTLRLVQDSNGGHTPTFNNVQWPDGQTPSWSTSANAIDVVGFTYDPDADVWYGMPMGYNFA